MKNLIRNTLRENLQQADKVYFKDGKLSPKVREHILNITNGDPYTKLLTDIYNQMLIENRKTSDDVLSDFYLTMLNEIYRELKNYNKNVFPISGFNINGVEDTADLINAITQREKILNILGGWSSIAKRNMKEDIREERNGRQMSHYLDQLEYAHGYLSMLNNRSEEAKNKILNKLFTNNTTIDNITDFIQDKGNLIGGEDLTKKQIHQILKKDKEEYDELKVKYNQNDIMIIEVSGPNGIKEIGCNSLWCFTYSRNNGSLNWGDWYNNSTNDVCYVIIDFKQSSDSEDFMYVLTKPIVENSEEYDEHDDENEGSLYDMSNEPVYSPIHTLDSLIGLDKAKMVMNFGVKPPKPKRQKYVDPNQLALDLHETKKLIKKIIRETFGI